MNTFKRKGVAVSGIVGLLALVLFLGVASFALYTNYRTSGNSNASEPVRLDTSNPGYNCRTDFQCIRRGGERGMCVSNKCVYASDGNQQNSDLGLKVTKSPLTVSWKGPKNAASDARFVVTIRKEDGTNVSGEREVVTGTNIKTVSFATLNLPDGKYYAQLRYVPKNGSVIRQTKNFTIGGN